MPATTETTFTALDELRTSFEAYLAEIQAVEVSTPEQYEAAAFGLKSLKGWIKDITDYFEPDRKRTYDAYTAVTTQKALYINKAEAVEKVIKSKMGAFQKAEQDRIRQQQIAQAQAEAEARRQLAASMPTPDAPAMVPEVIIPQVQEPTKVSGISITKVYRWELEDSSKVRPIYFKIDEAMVSKVVRDFGPDASGMVGGIRVIEDVQIGSRRG